MIRLAITGPILGMASSSSCVAVLTLIRLAAGLVAVSRLGFDRPFSAGGPLAVTCRPTTHHRRPSLSTRIVPSRSVRSSGILDRSRRARVCEPGCPYSFP
jgi:hypothetical protein